LKGIMTNTMVVMTVVKYAHVPAVKARSNSIPYWVPGIACQPV
jgi:hypothetical protein